MKAGGKGEGLAKDGEGAKVGFVYFDLNHRGTEAQRRRMNGRGSRSLRVSVVKGSGEIWRKGFSGSTGVEKAVHPCSAVRLSLKRNRLGGNHEWTRMDTNPEGERSCGRADWGSCRCVRSVSVEMPGMGFGRRGRAR
jgi:hypothetical protein